MAHYQNIYNGGNGAPPVAQAAPRMTDWSGEVTPMPADPSMPEAPGRTVTGAGRSMKYVGNYVVATFLVGTQNTTSWEGILYDVGNDYMTIYQEGRDRYIVSDIYSLKFIEFYDTRCRDICDEVLRSGWMPNQGM